MDLLCSFCGPATTMMIPAATGAAHATTTSELSWLGRPPHRWAARNTDAAVPMPSLPDQIGPDHGLREQRACDHNTDLRLRGSKPCLPCERPKTSQLEEPWHALRRTRRSRASACGFCAAWLPASRAETLRRGPLPSGHNRQARPGWFRREGRRSVSGDAMPTLPAGHAGSARLLLGS